MKVVYIVTAYWRKEEDVITPWLVKLIDKLKERGIDIKIFTSSYRGLKSGKIKDVFVYRFRYFFKKYERLTHECAVPERLKENKFYYLVLPFYLFFGIVESLRFAKKYAFDIIHVHWPFPLGIFGYLMKLQKKKKMIFSFHSAEIVFAEKNFIFKHILKFLVKKADFITVNSSYTKEKLFRLVGELRNIEIVPFASSLPEPKESLPFDKRKEILFVGRLVERKGGEYLLRAAKILKDRGKNYKIKIVGKGPLFEDLKSLKEKLDLDNVEFCGFVSESELVERYRNARIFVLPAIHDKRGDTEGLGVVLLEAISYGVPVIASAVGGIVDIVKNGETGILVPEKDEKALADAIEKLFEDKEISQKLVDNAKKYVKEKFSIEGITKNLIKIYERMMKNGIC